MPAVHKLRADVAKVFAATIGSDPRNDDVHYLAESQRMATRAPDSLRPTAGMTGANFAVAETGAFVVCTNEGNADLSANVPQLHIASIGIEKIIPRHERSRRVHPAACREARWARRSRNTPRISARRAPGAEMHIVLVDNGRSERLGMEEFWYSLKCIRCGACMNTCPVYRRSGGLSYGATYSGPIGADHRSDFRIAQIQQSALRLDAQRQLHQRLPGEDQYPRSDLQMAAGHGRAQSAAARQEGSHRSVGKVLMAIPGRLSRRRRGSEHGARAVCRASSSTMASIAWGKHRETPHPPAETSSMVRENRRRSEQP